MVEPRPREAKVVNCVLISLYGACFLLFLKYWMNKDVFLFRAKFLMTYVALLAIHFLLLYKRQWVYDFLCSLIGGRIRFFEFPYFVINVALYLVMFLVLPFLLGLVPLEGGVAGVFGSEDLTMFVLFGGGAAFVAAAIAGFDIYPVSLFRSERALIQLIEITRHLMRFGNRLLGLATSAVILAWAFKKVEFSMNVVYLTAYGVVGFALGGTAVLGSRVTELLYLLEELEP